MIVEYILFLVFAAISVISALCVVTLRNPVHCAGYLIVTLLQVAALFLLCRSPFLAVVQVFIYVGAVLVLFLFVVLLMDVRSVTMEIFKPKHRPIAYGVVAILLVETLFVIFVGGLEKLKMARPSPPVEVETLGRELFTNYIFPFEIVSVVLLVAMVGAIVMAIEKRG